MIPESGTSFRIRSCPTLNGRNKALKDHLVGITRGALLLLRCAHRPGQQWTAKEVARDPWRGRRELVHPVSDKMRLGTKAVAQIEHAVTLLFRQLLPVIVVVVALRDDAARQVGREL